MTELQLAHLCVLRLGGALQTHDVPSSVRCAVLWCPGTCCAVLRCPRQDRPEFWVTRQEYQEDPNRALDKLAAGAAA